MSQTKISTFTTIQKPIFRVVLHHTGAGGERFLRGGVGA